MIQLYGANLADAVVEIALNETEINAIDMICHLVTLIIQKSDQTSIDLTGSKQALGTSSTMVSFNICNFVESKQSSQRVCYSGQEN